MKKKKNVVPLNFISGGLFLVAGIIGLISGNTTMGIMFIPLGFAHCCLGLMNAAKNKQSEGER